MTHTPTQDEPIRIATTSGDPSSEEAPPRLSTQQIVQGLRARKYELLRR